MTSANRTLRHNPADEPLWLVVQRDDRTQSFEFPPHAHKAIVVGSCGNSDLRIRGAGPVACFLEREGSSICLTSAHPDAEIRVDALKVEGRRQIYTFALVEIANVKLRFKVRDTPPTLRGDGGAREISEVSDPLSKRSAATLNDITATTTMDSSTVIEALGRGATQSMLRTQSIPEPALATKTVEVDAFGFDGWFDDTMKEGTVASNATLVIEQVPPSPITSSAAPNSAAIPVDATSCPPRPQNIKTQEMAPLRCPPEPASMKPAQATPTEESSPLAPESPRAAKGVDRRIAPSTKREARRDPYRTIEMAPIRVDNPVSQSPATRVKLKTLRRNAIQLGRGGQTSETTAFDVPAVNPNIERSDVSGSKSAAPCEKGRPARDDRCRIDISAPAMARAASTGSDPWFLEDDAKCPVGTLLPTKVGRRLSSFSRGLQNLGLLAKRRPVLVVVGAACGSLVLVLFFAGMAKLISPQLERKPQRVTAVQRVVPRGGTSAEASKARGADANEASTASSSPSGTVHPSTPANAEPEGVPAAIAAVPDVTPAVGHLFAGRLPEAAQAYRELAHRFPDEPAFQSAYRILARKNSPACRGTNSSKTACPSVIP